MKKNKSEVIIVLDRSGSMESVKSDIEKGFKSFINKQKKEKGECNVSLYQFDDKYDTVFENRNIKNIGELNLQPRGWTALLDAIGITIDAVGSRLRSTSESERPETVIILVLSDGQENSSKRYTRSCIQNMVKHQTQKYNWHFVFVGANQDAVLTGEQYGFKGESSLTFAANSVGVANAYSALSKGVSSMRTSNIAYAFSSDERKASMESNS